MSRNRWQRLFRLPSHGAAKSRQPRPRVRLLLEELEDRLVPANNITIIAGAPGTGSLDSFLSATNGTITAANAAGADATLSLGALTRVGAGVPINITALVGITFDNIGFLNLATPAGVTDSFTSEVGSIVFDNPANGLQTGGGNLSFTASGTLAVANLATSGGNVNLNSNGNLQLDAAINAGSGTVSLSALDAVFNLASTGTDITAANLAVSAGSGIGASDTPLTTQVSNLVAQTGTGGIFINNTGNLTIGFRGDPFAGVQDIGTSGDIVLNNAGSVALKLVEEGIYDAGGSITLNATGPTADITTSGYDNAIGSSARTTVTAGRNLQLGLGSNDYGNDINGNNLVLTAGSNITLDEGTHVASNGGTVTVTAGGNISLLATDHPGAAITANGGGVTIKTGSGGTFSSNSGATYGVFSDTSITIQADVISLAEPLYASGTGSVTLEPVTSTRSIVLGVNPSFGNLGLGQADLNEITANVLIIGAMGGIGNLNVAAPITAPSTWNTLVLRAGQNITETGTGSLTVTNLAAEGVGVNLITNASTVANLAGASAGSFFFLNNESLTIASVDGIVGVSSSVVELTVTGAIVDGTSSYLLDIMANSLALSATTGLGASADPLKTQVNNLVAQTGTGGIFISNTGNLTLGFTNEPFQGVQDTGVSGDVVIIDTGSVTNSAAEIINSFDGNVTIVADTMTFAGAIFADGTVTLEPETKSRPIVLGTKPAGSLGLSQGDLNQINAALQIGSTIDVGGITVTAPITAPSGLQYLGLATSGSISETGAAPGITVTHLVLQAGNGITLQTAVTSLAFVNQAGAVQINNSGALNIDPLLGLAISANYGTTTSLSAVGYLTFGAFTSSNGNLTASSTLTTAGPSDDITVDAGVMVQVNHGNLLFQAADNLILKGGSSVEASGTVTLDIGYQNPTGASNSSIAGMVGGGGVTTVQGNGTDVLLLDFAHGAVLPSSFSVNAGGGNSTLTLSDTGNEISNTYALDAAQVGRNGFSIPYTGLASIIINGSDQNDTFNVTPSATTAFTVNGGSPTPGALFGDVLNLSLAGPTAPQLSESYSAATGYAGTWTFGNRQAVTFTGIETPGNAVTTTIGFTTFTWAPVTGAVSYDLWVDDLTTGQSQVVRFNPEPTTTQVTLDNALTPGHLYQWWIGSINSQGTTNWGNVMFFKIDPLAAPTPGAQLATLGTVQPTFSWTTVPNANHYDLWVNDLTTGQSQLLRLMNLTGTSVTLTAAQALTLGHTYQWWIGSVSTNGQAETWSAAQTFNIAPVPQGPIGGIVNQTPAFSWSGVIGADHYDLWVDDTTTGQSQVLRVTNVTGLSLQLTAAQALTPGHTYTWWIGAVSANGQTEAWSVAQTFTLTALTAPVSPGPIGGTVNQTPTFGWFAAPGADHYDLWVDDATTGQSQVLRVKNVTGNSLTLTVAQALTPGHTYHYWVGAVSINGLGETWSAAQTLSIAALGTSTTSGPTGIITTDKPTFSWAPGGGATAAHFDLWVNDLTSGQSQVLRLTNVSGISLTLTAAQALTPGHSYQWWIGAVSINGLAETWSAAQTFSIAALAAPVLTGPSGSATITTPAFSWQGVAGADHYDLWVDDMTTGQSQVLRVRNVAGLSYTPTVAQSLVRGHTYRWWLGAVSVNSQVTVWSDPLMVTIAG